MPELAVLLSPLRNLLDAIGLELIDALSPFLSLANQSRPPKHAEVS